MSGIGSSLSTVRPHKRSDAEPEASHAGSEVQREPDHSEGSLPSLNLACICNDGI